MSAATELGTIECDTLPPMEIDVVVLVVQCDRFRVFRDGGLILLLSERGVAFFSLNRGGFGTRQPTDSMSV